MGQRRAFIVERCQSQCFKGDGHLQQSNIQDNLILALCTSDLPTA